MYQKAIDAAIASLHADAERLRLKSAEKSIRRMIFAGLPNQGSIKTKVPVSINVDTKAIVSEKAASFNNALADKNWMSIITSSPVRESKALRSLVSQLGFQKLADYEKSVLKLLIDDEKALVFVRGLFSDLYDKLSGS